MVKRRANWSSPEINIKHSQIAIAVTSIVLSLAPLGTKVLGRSAPFLIESSVPSPRGGGVESREVLLKTDSGYPKDRELLYHGKPWESPFP